MGSDVTLGDNDIVETATDFDLDTITDANLGASALTTIGTFNSTFDGNGRTVSGLTRRSGSLFGHVDMLAVLRNLSIANSTIYVDPTDPQWIVSNDTVYVTLVTPVNDGKINNFGFAGRVIVDEAKIPEGKEVVVCLVGDNMESAELSGFFYDTDVNSSVGNKRCITIKQKLGSVKNKGKKKVATTKPTNKSLPVGFEYPEEELLKLEREFTAEEFASGVVAYWLNWTDVGYTGEYKPIWRQGAEYPVLAVNMTGYSNGLHKVSYEIDDDQYITDAPVFANNVFNRVLDRFEDFGYDTTYMQPSDKRWAVAFEQNFYTLQLKMDADSTTLIETMPRLSMNLQLQYRNISISFARYSFKSSRDANLTFDYCGCRWGMDFDLEYTASAKRYDGREVDTEQLALMARSHYVFRHKTFSYPAAHGQSPFQKRSAGSPLVGLTYMLHAVNLTDTIL